MLRRYVNKRCNSRIRPLTFEEKWQYRIQSYHGDGWQRVLDDGANPIVRVDEFSKPRHGFLNLFVAQKTGQGRDREYPEEQEEGHGEQHEYIASPNCGGGRGHIRPDNISGFWGWVCRTLEWIRCVGDLNSNLLYEK